MRLESLWRILCPENRPNRGFLGHRMRISGPGRILCPATRLETLPNRDHTADWSNKQLAHNRHHRPLASRKPGRARGDGHRGTPGAEARGSRQGKARASPRGRPQTGARGRSDGLAAGKHRGEPAEMGTEGHRGQERRARGGEKPGRARGTGRRRAPEAGATGSQVNNYREKDENPETRRPSKGQDARSSRA